MIDPARPRLPWLCLALLAGGCPGNEKFADDPPVEDTGDDTDTDGVAGYRATIRRTGFGVAHITADDLGSAGFGQAYAFAQDHACVLADQIIKVRSERAVFLGPGTNDAHVDSDFGYLALDVMGRAEAGFAGQTADVKALIEGYAAGYNKYLADTGVAAVPGTCQGQPWVRPISTVDLFAYYIDLGLLASGNPLLDPYRATALDLSYEKYFGSKAYVAAAYFYKDLKSYIYKQTDPNYNFTRFLSGIPPLPNSTINPIGNFDRPANGQGGSLSGVELSVSLPFDLLTPAMKGFGIVFSASFNNSKILIKDPDSSSSVGPDNIQLPGLSKQVYNLTAYYESGGFEARINQRRRSDFIGEIGNFNGSRTLRYVVGEDVVDAQIGYNFNDGPLKGLGLLLQVNNLTDSSYRTYYAGNKDRPLEHSKWGRTVLAGASYKF